ncbi:OmpA/MotB [uncultured Alphaproteobacteria bacterium]|uniref:OmpA/MotB n=1 Tax=uncultured Alphaproteobacteria bacterium TaxID=91750 RepID=A0A212JED8_9PROT|nr:OmpA/MotB [uncultured Alphaproteobacteria bacterium]
MSVRRARRAPPDIWPGFVDALSTLLIVVLFLLMVFVLAQFFLGQALSGRDAALAQLGRQVDELANLLSIERKANADLRLNLSQLSSELANASAKAERLEGADDEARKLTADIAALQALKDELEKKIRQADAALGEKDEALAAERKLSEEARAQAALLNHQLEVLREEIARLNAALDASEKLTAEQKIQIANLGQRLNQALASKVAELARYRSEFFGRLREILGNRADVRIQGDRFVFQSEVLFPQGSADLQDAGKAQLDTLARTLIQIAREIPPDLDWVLRVDGHTDKVPIATAQFRSNWELSSARAISVVRYLIAAGLPPNRLVAAGFGEYQPLDPGSGTEALARNRRIEFKLTER